MGLPDRDWAALVTVASFTSSGFGDLDRALAKLGLGPSEADVRDALHEGAGLIVAEAQRLVPYDTGNLHDSIKVTDDRDARLYGKVNGAGISVFVGPVGSTEDGDAFYAQFVEFGTRYMGAQPFMRPAIASKRPLAEKLILSRLAGSVLDLAK